MLDQATALMDRVESAAIWRHASVASFGVQHLALGDSPVTTFEMEVADLGEADAETDDRDLFDARSLVERHPDSPTALARLAAAEFAAGNRVSAEQAAAQVLESDSLDAPALVVATNVLASLGDFSEAERAIRKVHASASNHSVRSAAAGVYARISLHRRPPEEVLGMLHDCDDAASLTLRAWILSKMGRHADAIRDLRASLNAVQDNPVAWHGLSYAHAVSGAQMKALRASRVATQLAPAHPNIVGAHVALLVTAERYAEAANAVDRLIDLRPGDFRLIRLRAAVQQLAGDTSGALRQLRRAMRTTAWKHADLVQREELQFDIQMLTLFDRDPANAQDLAIAAAADALKRCDYGSLDIACFLADTTQSISDLAILERAHTELCISQADSSSLLGIESAIDFLKFDFDASTEAAVERARQQPCSEVAQLRASMMLSMNAGDYEQAARVCIDSIRRGIESPGIRNNAAFAYALAGDTDEAERVLPVDDEYPLSLATAGLIEIVKGNVLGGEAMYDECASHMREQGKIDTARQAEMHKFLARAAAGLPNPPEALAPFSELAETDPSYALIQVALDRKTDHAERN